MKLYLARRKNVMRDFQKRLEDVKRKNHRGTPGAWVNRKKIWRKKREEKELKMSEVLREKNRELIEFLQNEGPDTARLGLVEAPCNDRSSEYPSWESLPWPASSRIFLHLRTDKECADLANLTQVSTHFHSGLKEFMMNPLNRPTIKKLCLQKDYDKLSVDISLYPSNIPLHSLYAGTFKRKRGSFYSTLHVKLNGLEDPATEQVSNLLSSFIEKASIDGFNFTSSDFSFSSHLLRNSTFGDLDISQWALTDSIGSFITSLAVHTKDLRISCDSPRLSNTAAFITQLASTVSSLHLSHYSMPTFSFFGLPRSFWKEFLNEKLANGSFECIYSDNLEEVITKAPFILPDTPMEWLVWEKKA
ncbi:hypothetical protein PMAYCL1PPCAC_23155 [Pristionchus mayeri]|uniref:F-box domain-containing protein n=1 Tax=Pristionchus mayeri TaxID=1317129 RepID=A0AAN5CZ77_9BILA|nr:hypothetical protein PMAYCL1PPCAC_23155 [Pristionchus mayeri]